MMSGITISGKNIKFDGISIESLSKKYGTPLYIFSEKRIKENYSALLKSFRNHYKNTDIFFSIKTNFELQILKTLKSIGSNAEAASALEVELALKAGFSPDQIILDGPAWKNEEIEFCLNSGIHTFNVDSVDIMKNLNELAKKKKKKVNVSYRIFPEIKMHILQGFVEGYISKFGIPVSGAIEAYKIAKGLGNVIPNAISAHIGSMLTETAYTVKEIDILTKLAANLKKEADIDIKEVNIGGGFGVQSLNYYSIQSAIFEKAGVERYHKAPSIEVFGRDIAGRFSEQIKKLNLVSTKLVLEPGRFVVSDSGILVTRVVSVKDTGWVFVDGGINLIPESIFFIRRGFMVDKKVGEKATEKYNIAGPTLNTVDVLAVNQNLPRLSVGDNLLVLDAGAYSLTRSNQFTMLRPNAIYVKDGKKVKLLRRAEKNSEMIDKMLL